VFIGLKAQLNSAQHNPDLNREACWEYEISNRSPCKGSLTARLLIFKLPFQGDETTVFIKFPRRCHWAELNCPFRTTSTCRFVLPTPNVIEPIFLIPLIKFPPKTISASQSKCVNYITLFHSYVIISRIHISTFIPGIWKYCTRCILLFYRLSGI